MSVYVCLSICLFVCVVCVCVLVCLFVCLFVCLCMCIHRIVRSGAGGGTYVRYVYVYYSANPLPSNRVEQIDETKLLSYIHALTQTNPSNTNRSSPPRARGRWRGWRPRPERRGRCWTSRPSRSWGGTGILCVYVYVYIMYVCVV